MEDARAAKLKIVFMGTPAFAAVILGALTRWDGCEVVGVYTQPDRPAGRGQDLRPSQVKQSALAKGLPVIQPVTLKDEAVLAEFAALEPDVAVVAAYGLILPQAVLDIPRLGCVNVHASLLPKHRGAAPIQRSILAGDVATGITIMQMDAGLDTGDILSQRALGIGLEDTAATLHEQLAELGATLLVETLARLAADGVQPIPQDNAKATYAAKLRKEEGLVDFTRPVLEVHNRIRAMHPWPGAHCFWEQPGGGKHIKLSLHPGDIGPPLEEFGETDECGAPVQPGRFLGLHEDCLAVACAERLYLLPGVTPENKKFLDARSFYNGYMARCRS